MNPGLANLVLTLRRRSSDRLPTGESSEVWEDVSGGLIRGRRLKPRPLPESDHGDRPTERRSVVFRVRSRPFTTLYQEGDRLSEAARPGIPAREWEISGWSELESEGGRWIDVTAIELARH